MSRGNITKRGKKSWRIKVDIDRDPATGERKTIYRTVRGKRADAEKELTKILNENDNGTFIEPHRTTVGEYLDTWLSDYAQATVAPKTYERYKELLTLHVKPYVGSIVLSRLQPLAIQGTYTKLLKEGRRDGAGGLAPRTVQHVHRVLTEALKQAVKWRMIANNPAEAVEPPKVEDAEIETLTQEELAKVLIKAQGTKLHMPVLLAATTGMRRGEVLALRWSDVDLDKAELRVEQSLEQTKDGLRLKAPKTRRSRRTITLPSLTVSALRRHRATQGEERLALGLGGSNDWLVFTRFDGELVNPRNFSKEFRRLVKNAGVRPVTFHGLRHTHITQLLAAGEHVKVVSERAGHASIAITLQIYGHVIPGMQAGVADRLDAALRTVLENDA